MLTDGQCLLSLSLEGVIPWLTRDADEKYLFSEKRTVEEVMGYSRTNAKDIIAVGFDPKKTFIFSDFEYVGGAFYRNIVRFAKRVTYNTAKAVFGFDGR